MIRALIGCVVLVSAVASAGAKAKPVVTDTAIELLDPLYFEFGKAVIKPESSATLDAIAATLKAAPQIAVVEVQAHTDERGDETWNLKISQQRADAIVRALIQRGVEAKRLRAKGYGESQPLDRRHNPEAWAKNRRIAFVILQRVS